jgi:hypothetical protein
MAVEARAGRPPPSAPGVGIGASRARLPRGLARTSARVSDGKACAYAAGPGFDCHDPHDVGRRLCAAAKGVGRGCQPHDLATQKGLLSNRAETTRRPRHPGNDMHRPTALMASPMVASGPSNPMPIPRGATVRIDADWSVLSPCSARNMAPARSGMFRAEHESCRVHPAGPKSRLAGLVQGPDDANPLPRLALHARRDLARR